jgi:hypothetical protein
MATVTDTDLQQLRDLITSLHSATQKQITDGNAAIQQQVAEVDKRIEVGLAKVEAEIKGIQTQIGDIKTDQRAQDTRFFWLFAFLLTTAAGIAAKLAKLY